MLHRFRVGVRKRLALSQGAIALFMGVYSCTGPMEERGVAGYITEWGGQMSGWGVHANSNTFAVLKNINTQLTYPRFILFFPQDWLVLAHTFGEVMLEYCNRLQWNIRCSVQFQFLQSSLVHLVACRLRTLLFLWDYSSQRWKQLFTLPAALHRSDNSWHLIPRLLQRS